MPPLARAPRPAAAEAGSASQKECGAGFLPACMECPPSPTVIQATPAAIPAGPGAAARGPRTLPGVSWEGQERSTHERKRIRSPTFTGRRNVMRSTSTAMGGKGRVKRGMHVEGREGEGEPGRAGQGYSPACHPVPAPALPRHAALRSDQQRQCSSRPAAHQSAGGSRQRGRQWSGPTRMRVCRQLDGGSGGTALCLRAHPLVAPCAPRLASRQSFQGMRDGRWCPLRTHRIKKPPNMRPCMLRSSGWHVNVLDREVSSISRLPVSARLQAGR